jgi:hypothetical protein
MGANLQCSILLIFCFIQDPDCEIRDKMLREQQSTAWIFTSSLLGKKTYCIYYNHYLVLILLLLATREKPMELLTCFFITAHHRTFSTRNNKMIIARDTFKATISIFCLAHFIKNFFACSQVVTVISYAIQKHLCQHKKYSYLKDLPLCFYSM